MSDSPASPFHREPIFWSSDVTGNFNQADRERHTRTPDGRVIVERVPQQAHDGAGGYENPARLRNIRSLLVVRHDGNTVEMLLTNAAAHTDLNTTYAGYQIAKGRHYGWFMLATCPAALIATGELTEGSGNIPGLPYGRIADRSIIGAAACATGTYGPGNPCPHAKAEMAARKARHTKIEADRASAHKSETDKLIESNRDIAERGNQALIDALTMLAARNEDKAPKR